MKFATTLKSAALFSVLIIGIEGIAFAGKPETLTGPATSQPHTAAIGIPPEPEVATLEYEKASPKAAASAIDTEATAGEPNMDSNPNMDLEHGPGKPVEIHAAPPPVGRLLPAVQQVQQAREAAR